MGSATDQHPVGTQARYPVRLEWGPVGAAVVSDGCEFAVVVDVLSFTTTLTVACDLGIEVVPCPWRDQRAEALACEHDATLAVGRTAASTGQVSLSPGTLRGAEPMRRLVLPSPNGSNISSRMAGIGATVIGASLRNRTAAATWLTQQANSADRAPQIAVIAAGERWPDQSLRPAIEDLWGAGAVIRALVDQGWERLSPEADAAMHCFDAVSNDVATALHHSAGGVELDDLGFSEDVDIAAELDQSSSTPILLNGIYTS
ncbi:hypothetical protein FRP1_30135 (plasmid) [Pseudonocardia sp. EC080625-04]|uniref:2-phosphosulfolactate phosphatase n=1 Tax=unclassified Pseudonocardia TaxID=2619320 RepID=UPI0006CB4787|nr:MULTISPECIES: 2-phosphosulfolactate phosphatase [unclassified Pseudonocardia]ALE77043.1 hypothetical protein FRP1_30135 [Pseudonocardia sp. EC080625-04]ALL85919.1 hypothetical protein AD017_33020 [Pseudonocardia sp. EC080619-01]